MPFWLVFFLWLGSTVIGQLLRPRIKVGQAQPSSLGEFSLPTAQEGRAIPAVFGTVLLNGANVVWYGDLKAVPQKIKIKTGWFSSEDQITGYKYYLGQQLALCHGPIDAILEVRFDGKTVPGTRRILIKPLSVSENDGASWRTNAGLGANADILAAIQEEGRNDGNYIGEIDATSHGLSTILDTFPPAIDPAAVWTLYFTGRKRFGDPLTGGSFFYCRLYNSLGVLVREGEVFPPSTTAWKLYTSVLTAPEIAMFSTPNNNYVRIFSAGSGSGTGQLSWVQLVIESPYATGGWDTEGHMRIHIEAETLFGGEKQEGGVFGDFDIYRGNFAQVPNDYLEAVLGIDLPAYQGLCYVVARAPYLGTTPYLKPISFVVRRLPNQLGMAGGEDDIGGDANPACILYEAITNAIWGLGEDSAKVDVSSFQAAATVLADEGLGMSMQWDTASEAGDLILDILRHVDGVIFPDPSTGKLVLKLARADYVAADLPLFDQSTGVRSCKIAKPGWEGTRNVVKVRFVDRDENFTEGVATAVDLANVETRLGEVSEEEFPFVGLSNKAAAQRTAARVLRTVSYPLDSVELVLDRRPWRLRPGDVFRLTWAPEGIIEKVCRVVKIHTGELRDGRIRLDATEDIYGVTWTAYTPIPPTEWVDPIGAPGDLQEQRLEEVPYELSNLRRVMTLAGSGTPESLGYQVWTDPGPGEFSLTRDVPVLTPIGTLDTGGAGFNDGQLRVVPGPGMNTLETPSPAEFLDGSLLLVDDEIVAWEGIGLGLDGVYLVDGCRRGVLDTTPAEHLAGAVVYFITAGAGLSQAGAYAADLTLTARLLGYNSLGVQLLADAPDVVLTTTSRASRPYVPTAVLANGLSYPEPSDLIVGALTVDWSHRDRLGTWSYEDSGATATPEAGTTYTLRLYDTADVLRKTYTGLTGTSQTWTTEDTDSGLGVGLFNDRVRFELEAEVSGTVSHQMANVEVFRV